MKKLLLGVLLLVLLISAKQLNAQTYDISTYAGDGKAGNSGNGGQADSAELNYPWGIAIDNSGNVYIAEWSNIDIRKINTNNIISTFAGNGTGGYSGDGGPATAAKVGGYTTGIAVDDSGNVYIADVGNQRVRKVNKSGIISTIAGNGTAGYSGDGGAATAAELYYPTAIAVDAFGNLYIAESVNNVIRKVNKNGIISTYAGDGYGAGNTNYNSGGYSGDGSAATLAELNSPMGVAVDHSGNVYIADSYNNVIRKVNTSGIISTFAGNGYGAGSDSYGGYSGDGGAATKAELDWPTAVAIDTTGNIYISDLDNNVIRRVNTSGIISTIAGNGYGAGIGYAFTARKDNGSYSGDGRAAIYAGLNLPSGVAVIGNGNVFIADYANQRIRKLCPLPTLSISKDTTIYLGDSVQLFANSNGVVTWSPSTGLSCANCNDPIASPKVTTTYEVAATNGSCSAYDTIKVIVKDTQTGINNTYRSISSLTIFPNPTNSIITVNDNGHFFKEVIITDLLGRKLYDSPFSQEISMARFESGCYIVSIMDSEGNLYHSKVIKE